MRHRGYIEDKVDRGQQDKGRASTGCRNQYGTNVFPNVFAAADQPKTKGEKADERENNHYKN